MCFCFSYWLYKNYHDLYCVVTSHVIHGNSLYLHVHVHVNQLASKENWLWVGVGWEGCTYI